ncbi:MAG TPA: 30S ribosomal protein S4 [Candidatus Wolfebacteria bacterium]|nr:30S ribosomal protein S4 [Candidatus Wolfebacteria bacterium]
MHKSAEKKERSLGMKLFLKGERCNSPKCVMVRRPHKPGVHGKARRRMLSEYGQQLLEKQRIKVSYGLKEAQMRNIFKNALSKTGSAIGEIIIKSLERRFDNTIFRLGFASSRIVARQLINHGHFFVNERKVNIPSFRVKSGDIISIKPQSKNLLIFKDLPNIIKKYEAPDWLAIDKEKLECRIISLPKNVEIPFDINLVVDYYSR